MPRAPRVTHGVASGDVTSTSAIIWARSDQPAEMQVEFDTNPLFLNPVQAPAAVASSATDFTATVKLSGLEPDTRYYYRVQFVNGLGRSEPVVGTFRTAPKADQPRPVRFVVGGDLGGQQYCRSADKGGYVIFAAVASLGPDFFVANGDMIYADGDCPEQGPSGWRNIAGDFPNIGSPSVDWTRPERVREIFRQHWRYNRADEHFQRLLRLTPMYAQWDDHEVVNDFGARWQYWNPAQASRPGFPTLVQEGREAFFQYNPIDRNPQDPSRIYRSFRWGRDLELFVVDARSYRSRNDEVDGPSKTMLGAEQLAWLKEQLARSTATWKVVSVDVPISIPTGAMRLATAGTVGPTGQTPTLPPVRGSSMSWATCFASWMPGT